jgi:hypothetical protein
MLPPKVTHTRSAFSLGYAVEVNILANPARVWSLLTDAQGFPRWNSTVSRIEGTIGEGERLRLHVPGTERTFTPTVTGVVPQERMTWTGGVAPVFKGVRTFVLKPRTDGSTDFSMDEHFAGLMVPLASRAMPDLGPVFERFASDLKREAERPSP